jgi:hypothetical protein
VTPAGGLVAACTLVAAAIHLMVVPTPGSASCDATLTARSRFFTFETRETYPAVATDDSLGRSHFEANLSAMWNRLAEGLASAARCQARVERDRTLAVLCERSPCYLRLEAPKAGHAPELAAPGSAGGDSLLGIFSVLEGDSAAGLYSVLLGSYLRGSAAESLIASVAIPEEETFATVRDTSLALDIRYDDCFGESRRPTAFVLPPELTANRQFWFLSGLYVARDDAKRALAWVRREWMVEGRIVKIRATGPVLRRAFELRE